MDDALRASRMQLFDNVAKGLSVEYDQIRSAKLDSGLAGSAGENALIGWMRRWMPTRIGLRGGAIVSMNAGPTTQRDRVLFDEAESPTYGRIGEVQLLPIEGVLGDIELNYGQHTSYEKLTTDAKKLSEIGIMARDSVRRAALAYSHLSFGINPVSASPELKGAGLVYHQPFSANPVLLVFAEQINGNLVESARRIVAHNNTVGVRASIAGLFVLQQGFALHPSSDHTAWNATRQPGDIFACLAATPGEVLLKLQSVILRQLAAGGRVHPGGFDHYLSTPGRAEQEVGASTQVSSEEYSAQADDAGYRTAQA